MIVPAETLNDYNPLRYDAIDLGNGFFELVALPWWDESSYAAYQSDRQG